jgi:ribose/xylose/arabinose/galactoside ABC-type transport system permease subunit
MPEVEQTGFSGGAQRAYRRLRSMQEIGVLMALIVLCVALTLSTPTFLTTLNLLKVARQSSYIGVMAVGMVFVITMGDIDLSVGSILMLTGIVAAMALRGGLPVPAALLIGLVTGAACGFLNGILAVLLRIPMIIVTLGTLSVYRGLALILCQSKVVSQFPKNNLFFTVGGGSLFGMQTSVILMLLVSVIGWVVITRTVYGRRIEAIGGNRSAAHLSGVPLDRYRVAVMTVNGMIAALAGLMSLAYFLSADPNTGVGDELWVIAAVIIGGTALSGGQGSVPGAIFGALIIHVIRNGLVLLGAPQNTDIAVTGGVIILAVAIDSFVKRRTLARR